MIESFAVQKLRLVAHVHTLPINDNLLICQVKNAHSPAKEIPPQELVVFSWMAPTCG
jgi:hypothetical protein